MDKILYPMPIIYKLVFAVIVIITCIIVIKLGKSNSNNDNIKSTENIPDSIDNLINRNEKLNKPVEQIKQPVGNIDTDSNADPVKMLNFSTDSQIEIENLSDYEESFFVNNKKFNKDNINENIDKNDIKESENDIEYKIANSQKTQDQINKDLELTKSNETKEITEKHKNESNDILVGKKESDNVPLNDPNEFIDIPLDDSSDFSNVPSNDSNNAPLQISLPKCTLWCKKIWNKL